MASARAFQHSGLRWVHNPEHRNHAQALGVSGATAANPSIKYAQDRPAVPTAQKHNSGNLEREVSAPRPAPAQGRTSRVPPQAPGPAASRTRPARAAHRRYTRAAGPVGSSPPEGPARASHLFSSSPSRPGPATRQRLPEPRRNTPPPSCPRERAPPLLLRAGAVRSTSGSRGRGWPAPSRRRGSAAPWRARAGRRPRRCRRPRWPGWSGTASGR